MILFYHRKSWDSIEIHRESYAYSDSYDPDNYAYCDSRENYERRINRCSVESLFEI